MYRELNKSQLIVEFIMIQTCRYMFIVPSRDV